MLNRSQTTTFLQIFYELLLYSQVILKSMKLADDTSEGISECECVKLARGKGSHNTLCHLEETDEGEVKIPMSFSTAQIISRRDRNYTTFSS